MGLNAEAVVGGRGAPGSARMRTCARMQSTEVQDACQGRLAPACECRSGGRVLHLCVSSKHSHPSHPTCHQSVRWCLPPQARVLLTPEILKASPCLLVQLELWQGSTCVRSEPCLLLPHNKRRVAEVRGPPRSSLCMDGRLVCLVCECSHHEEGQGCDQHTAPGLQRHNSSATTQGQMDIRLTTSRGNQCVACGNTGGRCHCIAAAGAPKLGHVRCRHQWT